MLLDGRRVIPVPGRHDLSLLSCRLECGSVSVSTSVSVAVSVSLSLGEWQDSTGGGGREDGGTKRMNKGWEDAELK